MPSPRTLARKLIETAPKSCAGRKVRRDCLRKEAPVAGVPKRLLEVFLAQLETLEAVVRRTGRRLFNAYFSLKKPNILSFQLLRADGQKLISDFDA